MPRSVVNFETVRKIGLALRGVVESTAFGSPARFTENYWRVCLRIVRLNRIRLQFVTEPNCSHRLPMFTT
jgi:hypothetical protein